MGDVRNIRRMKERNRRLILCYSSLKDLLPKILNKTIINTYKTTKVFGPEKDCLNSIIVLFDKDCRMSVSDYFICAVRTGKKKKSTAIPRSKNLEQDIINIFTALDLML